MVKRKIEAEVELTTDTSALDDVEAKLDDLEDHEVEVEVEADDDDVRDLADRLDSLDDRSVEVDVDTSDGRSALERFDAQVEGLTGDARELRVEFKAQTLQREIRNALRDLEQLDDPAQIDVRTDDLERAQGELRDLAELAGRKYEIEIDADPKRNARRAAGDLDTVRERGEGLQSAIPALRGFTDELGGTAAGAGIASQAIADLGDTALIFGERFGVTGRAQKALTTMGTALGALGIGGVVIGGAVAGFQLLQRNARKTAERIAEVSAAIVDQIGVAEQIEDRFDDAASAYEAFSDVLLSDDDERRKANDALAELGVTIDELPSLLQKIQSGDIAGLEEFYRTIGQPEAADNLQRVVDIGGGLSKINSNPQVEAFLRRLPDEADAALIALSDLADSANRLEIDESASVTLDAIAVSSVDAADALQNVIDSLPDDATPVEILDAYLSSLSDVEAEATRTERAEERRAAATERAEAAADAAADAADDERARLDELADQLEATAQTELDAAEQTLAAADARRAAADSTFALRRAENDLEAQIAKSNDTLVDSESSLSDAEEALLDVADAAADVADAAVRQAQDQARANGETLSQSASTKLWNDNMLAAAATADGPLRRSILDYVASVNGIPDETVTKIEAAIARGDIDEANRLLDEASRKRDAEITAEADKAQAEDDLNDVARDRRSRVYVEPVLTSTYSTDDRGRPILVPNRRSDVDLSSPLPAVAHYGRDGSTPDTVRSFARSSEPTVQVPVVLESSTGATTNVQINLPRAADARDVVRAVDRWARVNGRQR